MSCFLIPNQVKSLFPFVLIASVKGTQYDQRNRTLFEQFKLFLLAWQKLMIWFMPLIILCFYHCLSKASELQSWLLFYSIPCLVGILPDKFLQHFACFVEAIYILLGDHITEGKLLRARSLLTTFYQGFQELYGRYSSWMYHNNVIAIK